ESAGELDHIQRAQLPTGVITGGIAKLALARVDRVPLQMRPLIEVAAVFGRQLDLEVLARFRGELDLESWLVTCANAAVLETRTEGWRFAHDKLREAMIQALPFERVRQVSAQILEAMEACYPGEARESKSASLAYFAETAGLRERAVDYHVLAGDLATRRCAYVVARRHYQQALDHLAALDASQALRRKRVDVLLKQVYVTMVAEPADINLARMAEAKTLLNEQRGAGLEREDRLRLARVDYLLGRVHFYRGDSQAALSHYREVLPVAQESGDDELVALPSCLIAIALCMQGEMRKAEPLMWQSILPLERLGEPFEWFRAVGYRGFALVALGRCEEGHLELERVHTRAREIGQPSLSSAAHLMRGSGAILLSGDYPRGLSDMQRVL
ncbi:MAG TPA: tetratricopeptide repeat protein, partial [Polyangiales bacterium]|nr:tetratricopeptide repeat protein [Polyangiales bacterium]